MHDWSYSSTLNPLYPKTNNYITFLEGRRVSVTSEVLPEMVVFKTPTLKLRTVNTENHMKSAN